VVKTEINDMDVCKKESCKAFQMRIALDV